MIEIVPTGMCKDCEHMRLDLTEMEVEAIGVPLRYVYRLFCKHEEVCHSWNDKMKGEHKDGKTG